jgi:hypothetical protein
LTYSKAATKNCRFFIFGLGDLALDKRMGDLVGEVGYIQGMQFETFDQFFRFRECCICGYALSSTFTHSSHSDEYIDVKPSSSYRVDKLNDRVIFPFDVESRASPYGEVSFQLNAHIHQNRISIQTTSFTRTVMSPMDFILKHLSHGVQRSLNIQIMRGCTRPKPCGSNYMMKTTPIVFNLRERVMKPFEIHNEDFTIKEEKYAYHFTSYFGLNSTKISVSGISGTDFKDVIELEADKYLRFPFEKDFLTDKVKTLILFS